VTPGEPPPLPQLEVTAWLLRKALGEGAADPEFILLPDETPAVIDRSSRRTWLIRLYETGV
jgi:hypothetical protein